MTFNIKKNQKIEEVQKTPLFYRGLGYILGSFVIPFSEKANRESYKGQINDVSNIVGSSLENLLRMSFSHPIKSVYFFKSFFNWISGYFNAQVSARGKEKFFVYTQFDKDIPFIPEEDIKYVSIYPVIPYIIKELSDVLSTTEIRYTINSFMELNKMGIDVFNKYPSIMPRFFNHNRLILKFIQDYDEPLNCLSSFHIAHALFIENIFENFFSSYFKKGEIFDLVEPLPINILNSVLYTKQHSIVDVSFGILCTKIFFEKKFQKECNTFISKFDSIKSQNPLIKYDEIEKVYNEILEMYRKKNDFSDTVKSYLEEKEFVKLNPGENIENCYFDTLSKKIVSF